MRHLPSHRALSVVAILFACVSPAFSQANSISSLERRSVDLRTASRTSKPTTPEESATILARFVAAEAKVREALNQHTFKRDVVLQTIGSNGEVTGEYIRNSQFVFDDRGKRFERVLFHPKSTIREMRITKEDIQDLAGAQLLGIDIVEAAKYHLTYVGPEVIDSLQLYAVDITPSFQPDPNHMSERYFVGRVWLDPKTFQIVKIKGIVEPQGKQRFPIFETWREQIENALAFPTRTEADDILHFQNSDVHYRIKVRYYNYKLFGSKVSVTELDEPVPESELVSPKTDAPPESTTTTKRVTNIPQPSDTLPKIDGAPYKQPTVAAVPPVSEATACATNRSAPPVGPYHWPIDTDVKVYFLRNMFTPEQRTALVQAMVTWSIADQENGSGVRFSDAGETDSRMSCRGCLTVGRRDVYKRDRHHYAFFHPMEQEEGRLLVSAWIDLDFGITSAKALVGFMAHELAHGLGLWDCTTCKKKMTIMNGFPGINKDNGLSVPSRCDLATVRDIYQEERQLVAARPPVEPRSKTDIGEATLSLPALGIEQIGFPLTSGSRTSLSGTEKDESTKKGNASLVPLIDLNRSVILSYESKRPSNGGASATNSSFARPSETVPAMLTFPLRPIGLDRATFSPFHIHDSGPYWHWLLTTPAQQPDCHPK